LKFTQNHLSFVNNIYNWWLNKGSLLRNVREQHQPGVPYVSFRKYICELEDFQ